jgi:hypothetical protein
MKPSLVPSSEILNQQEIQPETPAQDRPRGLSGGVRLVVQWIRHNTRPSHRIMAGVVGDKSSVAIRGRRNSWRLPARDA